MPPAAAAAPVPPAGAAAAPSTPAASARGSEDDAPASARGSEGDAPASERGSEGNDAPTDAGLQEGKPADGAAPRMTPSERRKAWAAYQRTFKETSHRSSRSEKVPEDIALKIVNQNSKNSWFEKWVAAGQSWCRVSMYERISSRERALSSDVEQWLTESQLQELYNNSEITQAMIAEKLSKPDMWRPHPEIPHMKAAIQYRCTVESKFAKQLEEIVEKGCTMTGECSQEAARVIVPKFVADTSRMGSQGSQGQGLCSLAPGLAAGGSGQPQPEALPVPADAKTAAALERQRRAEERQAKKDEEKAKKDEEKAKKAEERKQQLEEAKQEKRRFKESPAGQAKEWMDKLHNDVGLAGSAVREAEHATKMGMPPGLASEWGKTFGTHVNALKGLRERFESIYTGESRDASVDDAQAIVVAFKTDLKVFRSNCKGYK